MGDINMSDIKKILYILDYCEPLRQNIENHKYYLKLSYIDLNKSEYEITKNTINYLKIKNKNIFIKQHMMYLIIIQNMEKQMDNTNNILK